MTGPSAASRVLRGLWSGARRRCPKCRQGRMYDGFYGMREACAQCGHRFEPSPGEFTGALMFAQGFLGVVAAIGFIVLWGRRAPEWMLYGWLGLVLVVVPVLFYPNMKGAWLGFLYGVRRQP